MRSMFLTVRPTCGTCKERLPLARGDSCQDCAPPPPPRTSLQRQPPLQWNKAKKKKCQRKGKENVSPGVAAPCVCMRACVCAPHFAASPSEKRTYFIPRLLAGDACHEQALARRAYARAGCNFDWGRASYMTSTCVSYCLSFPCTHACMFFILSC